MIPEAVGAGQGPCSPTGFVGVLKITSTECSCWLLCIRLQWHLIDVKVTDWYHLCWVELARAEPSLELTKWYQWDHLTQTGLPQHPRARQECTGNMHTHAWIFKHYESSYLTVQNRTHPPHPRLDSPGCISNLHTPSHSKQPPLAIPWSLEGVPIACSGFRMKGQGCSLKLLWAGDSGVPGTQSMV